MRFFTPLTCTAFFLSILLCSCSNDDSKTEEAVKTEPLCNITSITDNWYLDTQFGTPNTSEFAFDAQGRIILAPVGSRQISFEYYTDRIILKYSNEAPNTVTDYYTLNDKKLITHLVRRAMNTYFGDTELKDYMVLDFIYNNEGYLTAIKEGDKQSTFTYTDGNLTNINDKLKDEDTNYVFSYNTNETFQALPLAYLTPIYHMRSLHRIPTPSHNPTGMAILTSAGYFGKLPKNQIKSIATYSFTYTKNDKKQIIKLKTVDSEESIDSTVYKFNYLCK